LNKLFARLLETFFNLLYHQFSWAYDAVAFIVSIGQWQEWVYSVIPYISGETILELGHGPGHLQAKLNSKHSFVVGVDKSHQMGRIASRRLLISGAQSQLVNGDASILPFTSNTFDTVVATFPTEYIYNKKTIAEIHRLLKPKGSFVLVPGAVIKGKTFLYKFAAWLFKITGQSNLTENSKIIQSFNKNLEPRFKVYNEILELKNSAIYLIRAIKI
jgi:ubiquinone/menaquinone biosynthesis C-methylase UbiE